MRPETEIMRQAPWSRIRGQKQREQRTLGACWQWKTNGQCSEGDNCSFRHDINKRAKLTQPNPSPSSFMQQKERNASEPEVPEARVPVVECLDGLARITSKELAPLHSVKNGILQNACSTSPRVDVDLGKSARMRIARLMNSLAKGPKRMVTKVQWLCWRSMSCMIERSNPLLAVIHVTRKATDLLCAVHRVHDNGVVSFMIWSRRSLFLRKSSDIQKPIQRVKFTKASARHTKIRDQNPSLGLICPGESKIWGSVSGGDRVARVRCPRSSLEAGQKCVKIKGEKQSNILLTFGK